MSKRKKKKKEKNSFECEIRKILPFIVKTKKKRIKKYIKKTSSQIFLGATSKSFLLS